ncbi:MAG: hypothetical protein DSY82_00085 [Flavobacteriia bacterium]|nr:MAG: hypothetical protein DSY82_00085 [Flavobacteriia bacterium]
MKISIRKKLAKIFRFILRNNFLKKYYFFFYTYLFNPYSLFKDITFEIEINRINLKLDINDWIQQNLYFLGEYEKAELTAIQKFIKKDSLFIDIGANFGLYSLFLSPYISEGQIISFEPFNQNFESLVYNIKLNKLSNIKANNYAIGDKNGVLTIYYNPKENNLGMASLEEQPESIQQTTKIISLDEYVRTNMLNQIDVIKIDIEGFEYNALLGMKNSLKKYHPTLLIEINNNQKKKQEILQFLKQLGYKRYFIDDHGNLSHIEKNHNRYNYIFTHVKNL